MLATLTWIGSVGGLVGFTLMMLMDHLPDRLRYTLAALFLVLVFASLVLLDRSLVPQPMEGEFTLGRFALPLLHP